MKIEWKKAFGVAGFLGGLCAVLALAIAGTDLLTKDRIAKNAAEKEANGLRQVFSLEGLEFSEAVEVNDDDFPTLKKYYTVTLNDAEYGRVYSTAGKNAYGDVALLVGLQADYSLSRIYVLTNTESYGPTLKDEYLDPYNEAEDKESAVTEVKCGATYGAKLCRDMILESKAHYLGGVK